MHMLSCMWSTLSNVMVDFFCHYLIDLKSGTSVLKGPKKERKSLAIENFKTKGARR